MKGLRIGMYSRFTRALLTAAVLTGLVFSMIQLITKLPVSAAAVPVLTLQAENGQLSGPAWQSGGKVGSIGKNGGTNEGRITFRKLDLPASGYYTLRFHYYSGSDDRYFNITTDDGTYKLACKNSGGWDTVGTAEIDIQLKKGGKLIIGSEWYGPDLDKIEFFTPESASFPNRTYDNRDDERINAGNNSLILDLHNGIYTFLTAGTAVISDAHAEAVVNGNVIASHDFAEHHMAQDGLTVTFIHRNHPSFDGSMTQTFRLRDDAPYLLTEVTLSRSGGISTNNISPVVVYEGGIAIDNGVFVQIPYDNDMWVEPAFTGVRKLGLVTYSYEVGAFYDAATNAGIIAGSVTHDLWKTGVAVSAQQASVMGFEVFGGITDTYTRDVEDHGMVSGDSVSSPLVFVGYYSDWRDGLIAYGNANAAETPPKASAADVPFGYNSWGVLQDKVSYSDMTAISGYIKENLQDAWTEDGAPVYVNIDSFWDFIVHNEPGCTMTLDEALRAFVDCCHKNGQKAGIYFTPFTAWHSSEEALKNARVEGTKYTYYAAALKRTDGSGLYGKLDGGYALDPTHPATVQRFTDKLNYFIDLGFEYVKLDFMAHGAAEGQHYDQNITTGIQAYNYGMAKILEICQGKMYVNLSIAPLFPYQYADGRRISCDAFASLDNTRHVLSYLTACFWEGGIYPYPDPDHLVVWGSDGNVTDGEARCRVTAGAISGTSFLVGDDLTDIEPGSDKAERILAMFGNRDIIAAAKLGRMFTPWEVIPGEKCAQSYWCTAGDAFYLAVFNFDSDAMDYSFHLANHLAEHDEFTAKELWRGTEFSLTGKTLVVTVPKKDAALYRITPVHPETVPADDVQMVITDSSNKVVKEKNGMLPFIIGGAAVVLAAAAAVMVKNNKKK